MYSLLFTLAVAATGLWGYIAGSLTPAVVYTDTLPDLYSSYNHFRMYEDGSYTGETSAGVQITGCIEGALCDDDTN